MSARRLGITGVPRSVCVGVHLARVRVAVAVVVQVPHAVAVGVYVADVVRNWSRSQERIERPEPLPVWRPGNADAAGIAIATETGDRGGPVAEAEIARARAKEEGKPENVTEKIVQGRLEKFKDEVVLARQAYIRDESITVEKLILQTVAAIGENVIVRRFQRWELGESLNG